MIGRVAGVETALRALPEKAEQLIYVARNGRAIEAIDRAKGYNANEACWLEARL